MKTRIAKLIVFDSDSILFSMKKMDEISRKLLIVYKDDHYYGLVSVGDIQRAIISNCNLSDPISKIMRNDYIIASPNQNIDEIKKTMLLIRADFMPVVDENKKVVNIYFWEDLFKDKSKNAEKSINLPVVIMAGGKGTRLKPITNIIPKPLLPLDDKTISEHIIDNFRTIGCDHFYMSVNYKSDMNIRSIFLKKINL